MKQYPLPNLTKVREFFRKLHPGNCGYVNCHQLAQFELHSWPLESLNEITRRNDTSKASDICVEKKS